MFRGPKKNKRKNSVTLFLVPGNCVRASKLRLGGNPRPAGDSRWGRRCASGRQSVFGLLLAFGLWPGKTRLASKARFTSKIRTMLHQQGDFPPANALTTSKPTSRQQARSANAPGHSGTMPTGEQAGPDGTPPKALNFSYPPSVVMGHIRVVGWVGL